ncbi:PilZ domain-containing protein [Arenimonas sp.]|uniref:PilZ domain-containing protein n=1 Tax=Arenimonas sp. TaxID=1872635 RepID=UPI0035B0DFD1
MNDHRFAPRVPYAARVMVVRDEEAWLGEVVDLSEGGCGLFRPEGCHLQVAEVVQLVFFDEPGPAVLVGARVARVQEGLLGFEYHDPQQVPPAREPAATSPARA